MTSRSVAQKSWFESGVHIGWLQLVAGVIATAITLTAYIYTTFQTKEDANTIRIFMRERFDKQDKKLQDIYNFLLEHPRRDQ